MGLGTLPTHQASDRALPCQPPSQAPRSLTCPATGGLRMDAVMGLGALPMRAASDASSAEVGLCLLGLTGDAGTGAAAVGCEGSASGLAWRLRT